MPYMGKAKEDFYFSGRNDFYRDKLADIPTDKLISDGTRGPYTLSFFPNSGTLNLTERENQIDVWVGGVFQDSSGYEISNNQLTFLTAPNINQPITVKSRVVRLEEGQLAKRSVGNAGIADDAITLTKMKTQTLNGFLGWDENGVGAVVPDPATGLQNRYNIAMNSFKIARNNSFSFSYMVDGIFDEYTDDSGINLVSSLNETHSVSGYFTNTGGVTMDLISIEITSNSPDPATGYIIIAHEFITSGNLNADIVSEVSRDGGNSWTRVVLDTIAADTQAAGINVLAGIADLRDQPTGSGMVYRIKTLNVEQRIHACSLQWRF